MHVGVALFTLRTISKVFREYLHSEDLHYVVYYIDRKSSATRRRINSSARVSTEYGMGNIW
jgi:hypothetical protein